MRAVFRTLTCLLALMSCGSPNKDLFAEANPPQAEPGSVAAGAAAHLAGAAPTLAGGSASGEGWARGSDSSSASSSGGAAGRAAADGTAGESDDTAGESDSAAGAAGMTGNAELPGDACLELSHPLELDYFLHVPIDKHLARAERSLAAEWYEELANVQRFTLAQGELNQVEGKSTGRVEAFAESWRSHGEWHEFAATYRLIQAGGAAIFQLKAASPVDWEVQLTHTLDGSIIYQPRHNRSIVLGTRMIGEDFRLRVRSNGREFEVYYNCELVERRAHPMDPSGGSSYAFRWGLYPGLVAQHDMALEVRGASWN